MNLNALKQLGSRLAVLLSDSFFPIECLGCAQSGVYLCQSCLSSVAWQDRQLCHFCKTPSPLGAACSACPVTDLDGVLVMAQYQGLIKSAIRTYKYQFVSDLAPQLSELLNNFFSAQAWPHPDTLIMPLPLAPARARWRGFNQSELLARQLAQTQALELNTTDLIRLHDAVAQAKLSLSERLALSADNFLWRGQPLNGRPVIIVDDVISTGQTLSATAKALKAAGASVVWGLVLARGA